MKINIDGLSVNLFGEKTARAIVFVHGFPYDHLMWKAQYEALSEKYFCVAYDIRGLGESEIGDGQYTMESYVDDLVKIIQHLELNKPILCGLSMGGYISLRALEREPNLFGGAMLLDTHPYADDNAGKLKRANAIKKINTEGLAAYVESFVPTCFSKENAEKKPDFFLETLARCRAQNPIGVKGAQIAMLSRTSTFENLEKIKIPVLVLVGESDNLTPPGKMKDMAEKIPNADFVVVPSAGHMTPIENPQFVTERMEKFLEENFG
jgi:pimeloyl-ACP methyl ester carboxylesterase